MDLRESLEKSEMKPDTDDTVEKCVKYAVSCDNYYRCNAQIDETDLCRDTLVSNTILKHKDSLKLIHEKNSKIKQQLFDIKHGLEGKHIEKRLTEIETQVKKMLQDVSNCKKRFYVKTTILLKLLNQRIQMTVCTVAIQILKNNI